MAKPDSERGKYGAWIRRNRKRLYGNNLEGLTTALRGHGVAGEPDTIRGWEAGADPSPDTTEVLEQIFGEPIPETLSTDTDLAAAIREQAAAIDRLAAALEQDREDGPPWAEALARILGATLQGPRSEGSSGPQGSDALLRDQV